MLKRHIFWLLTLVLATQFACGRKNDKKPESQPVEVPPEPVVEVSEKSPFPELAMTLAYLRSYYYDPTKLKPAEMLAAGLEELQSEIASVAFVQPSPQLVTVQVDKEKKNFDLSKMTDMGKLEEITSEILLFVTTELKKNGAPADEIEGSIYGVVNGMLEALDPYSVLIKPKYTDDLDMQTKGEYGGVGMVLSVRDWEITCIHPTEGTPAFEEGVKEGDVITQIDDESTVNMLLNDAVDLIRGPENTDVKIVVRRRKDGRPPKSPTELRDDPDKVEPEKNVPSEVKNFTLRRRQIKLESVFARWLPGNVLYLRINHFINYTTDDLTRKYEEFTKEKKPAGLILDLANNPGGLLPQSVTVSNAFLPSGVIVSTVGAPGTQKQVFHAEEKGTLNADTPMVVLVSSQSASASEIVAGALKGQNRALVVGETTYGKGTVQQIFHQDKGQPILKMTIREYLTPGDVSIQQVGVVPHVRFVSVGVVNDIVSLFWPDEPKETPKRTRTIKSDRQRPDEAPRYEVRHFVTERPDRDMKNRVEDTGADEDTIEFARRILVEAGKPKASDTLAGLEAFVKKHLAEEDARLVADLARRAVDWKKAPSSAQTPSMKLRALVCASEDPRCEKPQDTLSPGQEFYLEFQLENTGTEPLTRVYGVVRSPAEFLDGHEYLFGAIAPGKSFSWRTKMKIPHRTAAGLEPYQLELYEQGRGKIGEFKQNLVLREPGRPKFAFSFAYGEESGGDGLAQKDETFLLHMLVKNIGDGPSEKVVSMMRNESKNRLFLLEGRTHHEKLLPGQEAWATMKYRIQNAQTPLKIDLSVFDTEFSESVSRQFDLPVGDAVAGSFSPFSTLLPDNTAIWHTASVSGQQVATGSGWLEAVGMYGTACRVKLADRVFGFATCTLRTDAPKDRKAPAIIWTPHVVPPRILLSGRPDSLTKADSITLMGEVVHPVSIRDFYIIVSNYKSDRPKQKIFYAPGKGGTLKFESPVPLTPGLNQILLVARHDKDLVGHLLLSIVKE